MTYNELQKKHKEGFQSFEMFFAYSNRQLEEGLTSLGLKKDDLDKIAHIGGGGYIRVEEYPNFLDKAEEQAKELDDKLKEEEFFKEALTYELENHEYCITNDVDDALDALGLTRSEIDENKNQREWMTEVLRKMN